MLKIDFGADKTNLENLRDPAVTLNIESTEKEEYSLISNKYMRIVAAGYPSEEIFLGKIIDYSNSIKPGETTEHTVFMTTDDGRAIDLFLENIIRYGLDVKSKRYYVGFVEDKMKRQNYNIILGEILNKIFFENPECKEPEKELVGDNLQYLIELVNKYKIY